MIHINRNKYTNQTSAFINSAHTQKSHKETNTYTETQLQKQIYKRERETLRRNPKCVPPFSVGCVCGSEKGRERVKEKEGRRGLSLGFKASRVFRVLI